MITLYLDKLYRYPRTKEPCSVALPFAKGQMWSVDHIALIQEGQILPVQSKVTARYEDDSIKYAFVRFLADIPANRSLQIQCEPESEAKNNDRGVQVTSIAQGFLVDCGELKFTVKNNTDSIIEQLEDGRRIYQKEQFRGPYLKEKSGVEYAMKLGTWSVVESGPVCAILSVNGSNLPENSEQDKQDKKIDFELRITAYAGKPWIEIAYRLINTSMEELNIESLVFSLKADDGRQTDSREYQQRNNRLDQQGFDLAFDSTGCGDAPINDSVGNENIFHTRGITQLPDIEKKAPVGAIRTIAASSNYKTEFYIGKEGETVSRYVDDRALVKEANEHFAEVLYGTFFADRTDSLDGVCITIFQAQQNYPKAVLADKNEIQIMLVPEGIGNVVMQPGMAREQRFLMHFHSPEESIVQIDNRSLIYQMPDCPYIAPEVYHEAGVMADVFPEKKNDEVEIALIARADGHARCYGMLNWGDSWDQGYTKQGRGNGKPVWSNNEYDFAHSCALQYARTGIRRYLDYLFVSAQHWMDVDVCHYSDNPLHIGGQWEHTAGHSKNGVMVCSHEWVEGLLDYYHFSGDERAFKTAVGIGENVMRLLDTPMYAHAGEANARETGWALRTLTAMYVETHEKRWLEKCEGIVHSFEVWEEEYGHWLAPYTDNTTIRVGFMISVAIGSLMRYYRVFPSENLKSMILRAVDDLVDNCQLSNGLFYYKELPSLSRLGNNTLLLESMAIGYELSGNISYLKAGIRTFQRNMKEDSASTNGEKIICDDAVICAGGSTKGFAQSFIPVITYYKAASDAGLI